MNAATADRLVIDATAIVALVADAGDAGGWVAERIAGATLAAPHLARFEAGNVLRRHEAARLLQRAEARLAFEDMLALPIQLVSLAPIATRAWQLRHSLTLYDATYVALAETLGCALITLDGRLARAPGVGCPVLVYRPPQTLT